MFLKYSDCNEKQKMQTLYVLSMKDNNDIILKTANNSSVYCHMETKCNFCAVMVVGFTTTHAISAYHHKRCEFESAQARCTR